MQRRSSRCTEGHGEVHEIRVLRRPLVGLAASHGPADNSPQVRNAQVLRDELVLRAHVVVEGAFGERARSGVVGWRGGLAVAEEGGDDDVVVLGVEGLVFPD